MFAYFWRCLGPQRRWRPTLWNCWWRATLPTGTVYRATLPTAPLLWTFFEVKVSVLVVRIWIYIYFILNFWICFLEFLNFCIFVFLIVELISYFKYNALIDNLLQFYKGVFGLFRGLTPALAGMVPYAGLNFAVFETLKAGDHVKKRCEFFNQHKYRDWQNSIDFHANQKEKSETIGAQSDFCF